MRPARATIARKRVQARFIRATTRMQSAKKRELEREREITARLSFQAYYEFTAWKIAGVKITRTRADVCVYIFL